MFSERRILSTAKLCLPRQTAWKFATRCYTLLAGCGLNRSPSFDPLANLEVFAMQPPTFNSAMKTIERSAPRCSSSRFLAQRRVSVRLRRIDIDELIEDRSVEV